MNAAEHYAAAQQGLGLLVPGGDAVPPVDDQTLALMALTHAVLAVAAELGVPETVTAQPAAAATEQAQT